MTGAPAIPASHIVGCTLVHQLLVSSLGAAVPVVMPELTRSAGLFEGLAGLYSLMMYVGAVAATLAGEHVFRRLGAGRTSALAVALAAAGLVAVLPLSMAAFVLGALVIGLGYGPVSPASSHLMAGIVGRRDLNLIFSIRQSGAPLGVLVTGLVLPPLVVAFGWRWALAVLAGAAATAALGTLGLVRRLDAAQPRAMDAGIGVLAPAREVIATPSLRRLVATSFLFSAMLATLNAFVPTVVSSLAGLDLARAGLCAAVSQAGAIAGRLLWGVVADRLLRPNTTLALIGIMMAGAAVALGSIDGHTPLAAILAISTWLGATAGGWGGVVMAQAAHLAPPGGVGRVASGVMVFNYLGVMLGPPVVGIVLALSASFFGALAAIALVALLGAVLALIPLAEHARS